MNLDKVINICKKANRFVVFKQDDKTQWLGDNIASYLITNYPQFTPEYLTASASLKPNDVEDTIFKIVNFPDKFETADISNNENFVGIPDITFNFPDSEYTPVFTSKGIRFIKTAYFEPFKKEEYELFERETPEGQMYFVVKIGMFVSAIIMAQFDYLDTETVARFKTIAEKMQLAHSIINEKKEEN